jgi:glucokinase
MVAGSKMSLLSGKEPLTAHDVYDASMAGDGVALRVFQVMGSYLGLALAGLINTLNPETIVIAGGMSAAWDAFIEHVRDEIAKRAFHVPVARAKLVRAQLGDDAGILGVARLALLSADRGISER